jgi:hypothetical protein
MLIAVALLMPLSGFTQSEDFVRDYTQFALNNRYLKNESTRQAVITEADRLQLTLDRFETEQGHPFIVGDTVYLIDFYEMETGFPSRVIWNGRESCYYNYRFSLVHWKVVHQKLSIETDASKQLDSYKPIFRQWVIQADTSAFTKYATHIEHTVLDGSSISFTRAVKVGRHWTFIRSNAYQTDIYKE